MFSEFTYTSYSFAVLHKPTEKWVSFEPDQEYERLFIIELVENFEKATKFKCKNLAEMQLKNSCMQEEMYGKKNFLEFDIIKFKISYTLEKQHE